MRRSLIPEGDVEPKPVVTARSMAVPSRCHKHFLAQTPAKPLGGLQLSAVTRPPRGLLQAAEPVPTAAAPHPGCTETPCPHPEPPHQPGEGQPRSHRARPLAASPRQDTPPAPQFVAQHPRVKQGWQGFERGSTSNPGERSNALPQQQQGRWQGCPHHPHQLPAPPLDGDYLVYTYVTAKIKFQLNQATFLLSWESHRASNNLAAKGLLRRGLYASQKEGLAGSGTLQTQPVAPFPSSASTGTSR